MRAVACLAWIALAATSAAAADCPPSAHVTGEPDVVKQVDQLLRERGIVVLEAGGDDASFRADACRHVTASVARGGARIMVWITDPDGRRVERLTEDEIAAATTIESWARRDLVSPLLTARSRVAAGEISESANAAAPATPGSSVRYALLVGVDAGVSDDRAVWTAARAQGCVSVGSICLGGIIRYAYDLHRTGATAMFDTGRTALDLSVTAGLPIERERLSLMPYVGLGQMATTGTRAKDLTDPMPQSESEQASALHVVGGCSTTLHFTRDWSLRVDLAALVAPFARETLGDPAVAGDLLPASPRVQAWLGFGIAYGEL